LASYALHLALLLADKLLRLFLNALPFYPTEDALVAEAALGSRFPEREPKDDALVFFVRLDLLAFLTELAVYE